MTKNKKDTTVRIDSKTASIIRFISKGLAKSEKQILKEVFEGLLDASSDLVGCKKEEFKGSMNMFLECRGNRVTFEFSGKSNLRVGSFETPIDAKDSEVDARIMQESKEKLEESAQK